MSENIRPLLYGPWIVLGPSLNAHWKYLIRLPGWRQDLGWADSEQSRGGRRRVDVQLERRNDLFVEVLHRHRRNVAKFLVLNKNK